MKLTRSAQADQSLQLYYAQLALNMLWTPLFFGGTCKIAEVR
jgi:tryptophan-rich sensory protein